ncbi:hypothetical protein CA13_22900 [Planctomycetes bacterium CA13]|uniref:Uncharacterized protein n=1 Tax=Novipirellula herctigrandis TaxID=2527986 RepID=A0A5C5Z0L0_9BACT|nr:hypothetical protein CA13_22900 [Planctomycetes bacterium CA13]
MPFAVVATSIFALLCIGVEGPFVSAFAVAAWVVTGTLLTIALSQSIKPNQITFILLSPFCFYLLFAYVYKAVASYNPDNTVVVMIFGDGDRATSPSFGLALTMAATGVSASWLAIWLSRTKLAPQLEMKRHGRINEPLLYSVILVSLVVKWIASYRLGWGVPGAQISGAIPLVTGVVVIYCRFGLLLLLTATIYHALVVKRSLLKAALASTVTMAFVLMDLGIGSKYSLVYVVVIAALVLFQYSTTNRRPPIALYVFLFFAASSCLVLYKYVNYYRFARLRGQEMSITEMVDFAKVFAATDEKSGSRILNRINGFEKVLLSMEYAEDIKNPAPIDVLIPGDFADNFTTSVTGSKESINAVGCTQIGFFALFCNRIPIVFFPVMLAVQLSLIALSSASMKVLQYRETIIVTAMVLAIFIVIFQFASGALLNRGKEFAIIILVAIVLDRYLMKNSDPCS